MTTIIKGPILIKGGTNELMDMIIDHVGKPKLPFTATGMTVTKNANLLPDEFKKGYGKGKKTDKVSVTVQPKVEPKPKRSNKPKKADKNLLKQIINSIEEAAELDIDGDGIVGNRKTKNGDIE